jgi:1,2-phenylacetyl-CoA epoxidase catalytic subunit
MTTAAVATYASREGAPARYLETLEQMMKSQAYRELAAAILFGDGLKHVPSLKWLKFMTWHIREEMQHYELVVRMYRDFTGQSVEPWVHERLAGKPLPMAQSWFELGMAQFLYDRGGFWQLKEYEECSYVPYREVVREIVAEERGHQELGERIVVDLCRDPGNAAVKQPLFEKWLRIGLLSFGRPGTEGDRYATSVGLKKREAGAVVRDFVNDIKPAVRAGGLRFPEPTALAMDLPEGIDWSI